MRWQPLFLVMCTLAAVALAKDEAQPFPRDAAGHARFQEVVQVEGVSTTDLYNRAKFWAAKEFVSAKNVIQLDDPALGRLVLKGSLQETYGMTDKVWFNFTLTVEAKDGRYRWTLDQLEYVGNTPGSEPIERELTNEGVGVFGRKAVFERFRKDLLALAARLQAAMVGAPSETGKTDKW
ncbi:MAG: DUF4468 domain-containing protein [Acidobacteriia bacterium]|nr:DUF4468 domain-containing protein [Terriglobia bacterium]